MLEDARPKCILTASELCGKSPGPSARHLPAASITPAVVAELADFPVSAPANADRVNPLRAHHPAYLIYTSGSTGTPKGVANGKLDRKSLPMPEGSSLAASYVAPGTPEQILLCHLAARLLGMERVGLADNFFHLGGHSLMATRLAAQIRAHLGRELPIHTIFAYPVFGELARQIGLVQDSTAVFDVLLPIRITGSSPPLFCLHPGTGLCWSYSNLLQITAAEQPIYGIQARGFAGDRSLPETLDQIVEESLGKIRGVRGHGPYCLLGWSFGGIIAHLIATRLQSEGEQIERLFLFDSYPPVPLREDRAIESKEHRRNLAGNRCRYESHYPAGKTRKVAECGNDLRACPGAVPYSRDFFASTAKPACCRDGEQLPPDLDSKA